MKRDEYEVDELQKQEIRRIESMKKARGVAMLLSGIVYAAFAVYVLTGKNEVLSLPKFAIAPVLIVIALCEVISGLLSLGKLERWRVPFMKARLVLSLAGAAAGAAVAVMALTGSFSPEGAPANSTEELTRNVMKVIYALGCLLFSVGMLCKFFRDKSILKEQPPRAALQAVFMAGTAPLFLLLFIGNVLLMWAAFAPLALGLVSGCILLFTPESFE